MKKLLALLMALVLVFSFAACGGNEDVEETTTAAPDETTVADVPEDEVTDAPADDATDAVDAPADETTVASEEDETTVEGEETSAEDAVVGDMTAAEFVAFYNAETAKIAKSGKYKFNRVCSYTDPIDVGGATDTLNKLISSIDENSNLDTVVGGFLGIGTKSGTYPANDLDSDYRIKAAQLKESDLGSFSGKDGVYTFTLANATNPKKTNATPISRFTNDFITHEEVVSGIADFTSAIKVESTTVNYKNNKVTVTVADGKITSIKYSQAFDAKLTLKLIVPINGSGAAVTTGTYSDIKY